MTTDEMLGLIAKGTPDFEPDTKRSYRVGVCSSPGEIYRHQGRIEGARVVFEFDVAKNPMAIKRPNGEGKFRQEE